MLLIILTVFFSLNTNPSGYPYAGGPLRRFPTNHHMNSSKPMQIQTSNSIASRANGTSSTSSINSNRHSSDCTPTFIEVGAGSYQEGMPIMRGPGSSGSQKSLNSVNHGVSGNSELTGENLIESIADAMNELVTNANSNSGSSRGVKTSNRHHSGGHHLQSSSSKSISPAISIQPSTSGKILILY